MPCRLFATTCICRYKVGRARVLDSDGAGSTAREQYLERIAFDPVVQTEARSVLPPMPSPVSPARPSEDFEETLSLLELRSASTQCLPSSFLPVRIRLRSALAGQYSGRRGKSRRLQILMDRQREIQRVNYARHVGQTLEAAVEGFNTQRSQVTGRSSQNKTVNFTISQPDPPRAGQLCSGADHAELSQQPCRRGARARIRRS